MKKLAIEKKYLRIIIFFLLLLLIIVVFFQHKAQTNKYFFDVQDLKRLSKQVYFSAQQLMPKPEPTDYLDIKFHHQEHSLSCEIAALKMILDWRGVSVSESDLIRMLAVSEPRPRQPGNIWGDPDEGFVGDINGKMPNIGYGVYEKPIYDIAIKWRRAELIENATLQRLLDELEAGNPSIIWGVTGSGEDISWKTKEGKFIKAVLGEHTRVLVGFIGSKDNSEQLILMDPIYGKIYFSTDKFIKNWAILGNKALVVF